MVKGLEPRLAKIFMTRFQSPNRKQGSAQLKREYGLFYIWWGRCWKGRDHSKFSSKSGWIELCYI